ncbi:MAG: hypothetical protein RL094_430 [Candidatus Parcubacteria bacterium]|jgi:hypothetical protein
MKVFVSSSEFLHKVRIVLGCRTPLNVVEGHAIEKLIKVLKPVWPKIQFDPMLNCIFGEPQSLDAIVASAIGAGEMPLLVNITRTTVLKGFCQFVSAESHLYGRSALLQLCDMFQQPPTRYMVQVAAYVTAGILGLKAVGMTEKVDIEAFLTFARKLIDVPCEDEIAATRFMANPKKDGNLLIADLPECKAPHAVHDHVAVDSPLGVAECLLVHCGRGQSTFYGSYNVCLKLRETFGGEITFALGNNDYAHISVSSDRRQGFEAAVKHHVK